MAKQIINVGARNNDGTGDSLRVGATKVNDNFSEIYNLLGDGENLSVVSRINAGQGLAVSSSTGAVLITGQIASGNNLGMIKVGANLSVGPDGTLDAVQTEYQLPTASNSVLGGIKVGTGLSISQGVLSANNPTPYTLPIATSLVRGGVKIGDNLSVSPDGTISGPAAYSLPTATDSVLGGIKIGAGLSISQGVVSVTGTTVTTDKLISGDFEAVLNGSSLRVPGIITKDDSLQLVSAGASTTNAASVNVYGDIGKVIVRADNGISNKDWEFNINGHLIPGSDNLQDIGSPGARVRHIYVGPGSITVGSSVITESQTGKLVLPGVTRATTLYADEVEDTADQSYEFSSTPFITDAYDYSVRAGYVPPDGYVKAEYSVEEIDDGYIDGINIDEQGIWTQAIAEINRRNSMYAYVGSDINEMFNVSNWIPIPFVVRSKANDVEYEFGGSTLVNGDFSVSLQSNGSLLIPIGDQQENESRYQGAILSENESSHIFMDVQTDSPDNVYGGMRLETWNSVPIDIRTRAGGQGNDIKNWRFGPDGSITFPDDTVQTTAYTGGNANTGNVVFDGNQMYVGGTGFLNLETDTGVAVIGTNGQSPLLVSINEDDKMWTFGTDGSITFPDNTVQTTAYTGGGGDNSYTPEDTDHWNEPTVNSVAAALDELAARVTALQNFEIDGGNAYTPPQGETIIDGNGA